MARIEHVYSLEDRIARTDGVPCIQARIFKESGANTVEVSTTVREVEERLGEDPELSGIKFFPVYDEGEEILSSLNTLKETALYGAAFAVVVLFFFLRRVRSTLMVTCAIPVSILMTVAAIYFLGGTLNALSMMGITLAVGMLVDNAVVVVESIQRKREEGCSPAEAALAGAREVVLPVVAATLTSVVVFLPLILSWKNEIIRFFIKELGYPVCIALVASLVVALVFIPTASVLALGGRAPRRRGILHWIEGSYDRAIRATLNHRLLAVIVAGGLLTLTGIVYFSPETLGVEGLKHVEQMHGDEREIHIGVYPPPNYTEEEVDGLFWGYETTLLENKERLGIEHVYASFRKSRGRIRLYLVPRKEREMSHKEVVEECKTLLPRHAGVELSFGWEEGDSPQDSVRIRLLGPASEKLAELGDEVVRRLRALPELEGVEAEQEQGVEELWVRLDREAARRYGVNPQTALGSISGVMRGTRLPDMITSEGEIPVIAEYDTEEVEGIQGLADMRVYSESGKEIPLGAVAEFGRHTGFGQIQRENGQTTLGIKALATMEDLPKLRTKIDQVMEGMDLPQGYTWDLGGRFRFFDDMMENLGFAILLSVVLVFLLLGVLFESVVLPFSVMISIPFAGIGVVAILWPTETPMDQLSWIGIIILVGIVVNNAIILVHRVNQLRERGMSRQEALVAGGSHRLRPILMTAITTISGLLPMTAWLPGLEDPALIGMPAHALARTVMGGLAASTLLTLFLVPVLYDLLDDLRGIGIGVIARVRRRRSVEVATP